jgi:hypothetical protein
MVTFTSQKIGQDVPNEILNTEDYNFTELLYSYDEAKT